MWDGGFGSSLPSVISPFPIAVILWDEELWQDCLGWLCFPKLCSEILAGAVAELWEAAAFLCPGFLQLANKLCGLKDDSGK